VIFRGESGVGRTGIPCGEGLTKRNLPKVEVELPQKFADRNDVVASAKNPTEGEVGEAVQRASRHDLVRALALRYGHVGKHEKGQILDQVCDVTGYTRKYALTLLTDPPPDEPRVKRTRRRLPSYGAAEVELLRLCWLVTDGICSKRLAPFLPELLDRLRRRQALREFPVAVQAHARADRGAARHQHHQS
jgi:hypothetical protein